MKVYDKIIVGAGASGMVAAICSARNGESVLVIERMEKVGKKIFATGNGKCNMTNRNWSGKCYRSGEMEFVQHVLERFSPSDTISFFHSLGLVTMEKDGYVYPNSQQASTVVRVLESEMKRLGVEVCLHTRVNEIKKERELFLLDTTVEETKEKKKNRREKTIPGKKREIEWDAKQREKDGKNNSMVYTIESKRQYKAKRIVLANGGMASQSLGSDGSGYKLAKSFGHRIIPVVPALTSLFVKKTPLVEAAGVRTQVRAALFVDKAYVTSECGELQVTSYGISGIVIFQMSRFAAYALEQKKDVTVTLDFFPQWSKKELEQQLWDMKCIAKERTAKEWLCGFLNEKLVLAILRQKDFPSETTCDRITTDLVCSLAQLLKQFPVEIEATNDFSNAQVCAGGVDVSQVTQNFESKLVSGLYMVGELLDVDGICGGYNLQWAFASGYLSCPSQKRKEEQQNVDTSDFQKRNFQTGEKQDGQKKSSVSEPKRRTLIDEQQTRKIAKDRKTKRSKKERRQSSAKKTNKKRK